jgi:hypothetical protein
MRSSPVPLPAEDPIVEAIAHLGAALMQADHTDDQIIIEHVRAAHALALERHREDRRSALASPRAWVPSIVPSEHDQTVYLVLDDFGRNGRAYCEADYARADRESIIADLIAGQYRKPLAVAAFNLGGQWAKDVSRDIARDIRRRAEIAGEDVSPWIADFVDNHLGTERQLTLRLV